MMKIGIPRALLYHRYAKMWETFFNELSCEIVFTPPTNRQILENGIRLSEEDQCLSSRIYFGHINELQDQCDCLLIPFVDYTGRQEHTCLRFNQLYERVAKTFNRMPLLEYRLNAYNTEGECAQFIEMGSRLGRGALKSFSAYQKARDAQHEWETQKIEKQRELLEQTSLKKVLLVSQPYLIHDAYIGQPVVRILEAAGIAPIFTDSFPREECLEKSREFVDNYFWKVNQEIIGGVALCRGKVDGVIAISSNPCSLDSLMSEIVVSQISGLPATRLDLSGFIQERNQVAEDLFSYIHVLNNKQIQ